MAGNLTLLGWLGLPRLAGPGVLAPAGLGLLEELGQYLQTEGLGTLGTTLFLGALPSDPALMGPLTGLFETPGFPGQLVHSTLGVDWEQPVVQVIVRGHPQDYQSARQHLDAVYAALAVIRNQSLSGTWYLWVTPLTEPFLLDTDDYACPRLTAQFRVAKAVWEP